jgi:hypothetical protein
MSVVLSTDEDVLNIYANAENIWPRTDHSWEPFHRDAALTIERKLRASKSLDARRFELGRLSIRSKEDFREAATCFVLSYIFRNAAPASDTDKFYLGMSDYYKSRAEAAYADAALSLDYDYDNNGEFDDSEQLQPSPVRLIRG